MKSFWLWPRFSVLMAQLVMLLIGLTLAVAVLADLTTTAQAGDIGAIPALLRNPMLLWGLKFVGVGALLKFFLSLQVGGKEVIDVLPASVNVVGFTLPIQSLYPHAVTLACYVVYNLLTGGYAQGFWPVFDQNLIAAGVSGSMANSIHDWWTGYLSSKAAKA